MDQQFAQFLSQYNGQSVEKEDPSNLDQCFDLAFAWVDFLNIPRDTIRHELAYQIFLNPNPDTRQYFDIYPNTPDGVPMAGDLVVFGSAVGPAGHVCIASGKGDINMFESFDQNWNTASDHHLDANGSPIPYSHLVTHNYFYNNDAKNSCLGWLRPILKSDEVVLAIQQQLNIQIQATSQCQTQLKTEQDQNTVMQNKVADLQSQVKELQSKYAADEQEIITLNDSLAKVAKTDRDYAQESYTAQQQAGALRDYLHAIANRLGLSKTDIKDGTLAEEVLANIDVIEVELKNRDAQIKQLTQNPAQQVASNIAGKGLWQTIKDFVFTAS